MNKMGYALGGVFAAMVAFLAAVHRLEGSRPAQWLAAGVYGITVIALMRWANLSRARSG